MRMIRYNILSIKVTLERLPKKEKGFVFEFVEFELGPEEEAVVQIGWVPQNGTPLRETILAKFGKFHMQIKINATGIAPIQKVGYKTPYKTSAMVLRKIGVITSLLAIKY